MVIERDDEGRICAIRNGCRDWMKVTADDGTEVDVRLGPDGVSLELHAEGGSAVCTPKSPDAMEEFMEAIEDCQCEDDTGGGRGGSSSGSIFPVPGGGLDVFEPGALEPGECRVASEDEVITDSQSCDARLEREDWDCRRL